MPHRPRSQRPRTDKGSADCPPAARGQAGEAEDTALAALQEEDPSAFAFDDDAIVGREKLIAAAQIQASRTGLAISFGSCSFREPLDELASLARARRAESQ